MFGHGFLLVELEPDFDCVPDWPCPWLGEGVVVVVELVFVPVALAPVVPVPLDAAEAPEMPAMAPPVASAPAAIVAPSILDTFIGVTSWMGVEDCMCEPSSTRPLSTPVGAGKVVHRGA
jgi:hypothetical protein